MPTPPPPSSVPPPLPPSFYNCTAEPGLAPPPGVSCNFDNPYRQGPLMLIVGSLLESLMLAAVAARLYAKLRIVRGWTADDLTCLLAAACTTGYYVNACYIVTRGFYGVHQWDVTAADLRGDAYLQSVWVSIWLSTLAFVPAKASFLILYAQVFRPMRWLRLSSYVGLACCSLFYLALTVFQLVVVTPRPGEPWLVAFQGPGEDMNHRTVTPAGVIGLLTDIFIFLLPIVGVMRLQLTDQRKVAVVFVFATGLIAVIASALSLYYRVGFQAEQDDTTWTYFPVMLCVLIELQIGVTCSSMPSVSILLKRLLPSWTAFGSRAASKSRRSYSSRTMITTGRRASGPYEHLDDVKAFAAAGGRDKPGIELLEFCPKTSAAVHTVVDTGDGPDARREFQGGGIHLTFDLEQESTAIGPEGDV